MQEKLEIERANRILGVPLHECSTHMSMYYRIMTRNMGKRDLISRDGIYNPIRHDGYWSLLGLADIASKDMTPQIQRLLSAKLHRKFFTISKRQTDRPLVSFDVLYGWWRWAGRRYLAFLQEHFGFKGSFAQELLNFPTNMTLYRFHVQKRYADGVPAVGLTFNPYCDYPMTVFQQKQFFYGHRLVVGIRHFNRGESAVLCLNHRMDPRQYWLPTKDLPTLLTLTPRRHDPS